MALESSRLTLCAGESLRRSHTRSRSLRNQAIHHAIRSSTVLGELEISSLARTGVNPEP